MTEDYTSFKPTLHLQTSDAAMFVLVLYWYILSTVILRVNSVMFLAILEVQITLCEKLCYHFVI